MFDGPQSVAKLIVNLNMVGYGSLTFMYNIVMQKYQSNAQTRENTIEYIVCIYIYVYFSSYR